MKVFDYSDYKKYVVFHFHSMPKKGHGQYARMANFLTINSVTVTQIFKGDRDLTIEQACLLQDFFGFSELENQYFVGLVEKARASHHKLKKMIQKRLDEILTKSRSLKDRLSSSTEMSEASKAVFYSNWYYSGVRLATSVPELNTPDSIARYFGLPLAAVNRALAFLIENNLTKEINGKLSVGPSSTHLEASSPLISRHHTNWRNKAIQRFDHLTEQELCLSMPCSLSSSAREQIRKELVNTIERISQLIDAGPEEELACLNIDWIKLV